MKEPKISFFSYIPGTLDEITRIEIKREFTCIVEDLNRDLISRSEAIDLIKKQLEKLD